MKKFSYILFAILFLGSLTLRCGFTAISKNKHADEKLIVKFSDSEAGNVHEMKYDRLTGAYAYVFNDSAKTSSYLVTKSGKSEIYSGINLEGSIFDKQGNFYCSAYIVGTDSSAKNVILKNSAVIASFDYLNFSWAEKNGRLFFAAKEGGRSYLEALDLTSGTIEKGKGYDDIQLVYYHEGKNDLETEGYPGFTKDGRPYYIASLDKKAFLVVGTTEQKPYAYINEYSVNFDNTGAPAYIANDVAGEGEEKSFGNYFVVQGTKEYQKFNYVYGQVQFNKNNSPLYGVEIKGSKKDEVFAKLYSGNELISSKYDGGYSYPVISPQGKVTFVGYTADNDGNAKCCLVTDGKEGKKYDAINNLTFSPSGVAMYVAGSSEKKFIIKGEERITPELPDILEYGILKNGKLYYAVFEQGDNTPAKPDRYFVYVDGQKYGPYENLSVAQGDAGLNFIADDAGNFAALSYKYAEAYGVNPECRIISNKGTSEKFDYNGILKPKLTGGKLYFAGFKSRDKEKNLFKGMVYADMVPVTPEYDFISDLTEDSSDGTINFYAIKGSEAYQVDLKY